MNLPQASASPASDLHLLSSYGLNTNVLGFPGGSVVKNPPATAGDMGLIPELGRSAGGGHSNPLQCSCLETLHGHMSLVDYSPWGRKESDRTEAT